MNRKYAIALENAAHLLYAAAGYERLGQREDAEKRLIEAMQLVTFAKEILAYEV